MTLEKRETIGMSRCLPMLLGGSNFHRALAGMRWGAGDPNPTKKGSEEIKLKRPRG